MALNSQTKHLQCLPLYGSSSTERRARNIYNQMPGKAENAVKACKGLSRKAKEDKKDPLLAILDWQNTPSQGFGASPVQRLMGRRTRTLLLIAEKLLKPCTDQVTTRKNLEAQKRVQSMQYNRGTKNLPPPLLIGDTVRMRLPGEQKWSLSVCTHFLGRRCYEVEVEVEGQTFCRNRRQLHSTPEPLPWNSAEEVIPALAQDASSSLPTPRHKH